MKNAADEEQRGTVLKRENFQTIIADKPVDLYRLKNRKGTQLQVTNFGGTVVALSVPDRTGKPVDVVLGYDTLDEYRKSDKYLGAAIGRYGNRIKAGKFVLDGTACQVRTANPDCSLHGGLTGFNAVVWDARQIDDSALELRYLSADGEEGFPGALSVRMTYRLTDSDEFIIEYEAETDRPTVLNLTNHAYFNLNGAGTIPVTNHTVTIDADFFTPADEKSVPTGEIRSVEGTPMDFRTPRTLGERIDADFDQLRYGKGYDHNYVLNKRWSGELAFAARAVSPQTGIVLEVYTTEPGMQLYTGNWLGGFVGKGGRTCPDRTAVCFETQHFPDSPNRAHFPTTVLRPGERYTQTCIYKFGVEPA